MTISVLKFLYFLNLFSDLKQWIYHSHYQHSSFSIWSSIHHVHNCIDTCPCRIHCNYIWLTSCIVPYKVGIVPVANNYLVIACIVRFCNELLNLWSIHFFSCFSAVSPRDQVSIITWSYWLINERYNLLNKWLFFLRKKCQYVKGSPFFPKYSLYPSPNFIGNIFWLKSLTISKFHHESDQTQTTFLSFVKHHTLDAWKSSWFTNEVLSNMTLQWWICFSPNPCYL